MHTSGTLLTNQDRVVYTVVREVLTLWYNTEYRSFVFCSCPADNAKLKEREARPVM